MSQIQCRNCTRPTDLFLCRICAERLADDLGDVPALVRELEVTFARLHRLGGSGARGAETPVVFHVAAADAAWTLANVIGTWAASLAEDRGLVLDLRRQRVLTPAKYQRDPADPYLPPNDVASLSARWLLVNIGSVRMSEAGAELMDEIIDAVRHARHVVDRPPDLLAAGPCGAEGCESVLYFPAHAEIVTCRECGAEHDVEQRREWMIATASELLVSAPVALGWVRMLMGKTIPDGTWRSWLSRGRVLPHGLTLDGRPTYRFSEVRDLALEHVAKPRRSA